jgi:GNAT superfamily N-acetyltransferase
MTYYDDVGLKERLYNLGFGSYVIDACRKTDPQTFTSTSNYRITEATQDDVDEVLAMENEFEDNLLKPPVFLVRQHWKRDEVVKFINEDKVFVAWDKDRAIGMMSVNINQKHHFEHLTNTDSAGSLCAYIRPEYRGKGVGTQILHKVCEYSHENGKPFLHVSFESANPDAIRFWPKHFKPATRSVRRGANRDANR